MNLARHSRNLNGSHSDAGREKKFEIYGFHSRKLLKNVGAFLQFPIFFHDRGVCREERRYNAPYSPRRCERIVAPASRRHVSSYFPTGPTCFPTPRVSALRRNLKKSLPAREGFSCAPRDDLCVLRVSAVKSVLVAAGLHCVHLWFHLETDTTLPGFLRRWSDRNRGFSCRSTPRIPSRYSGISRGRP